MAKSLKDLAIVDETGEEVSGTDLEEFLDDHEIIPVDVERKGKTLTFHLELDNSRIEVGHLSSYRRSMAEIAVEAAEIEGKFNIEAAESEVEGEETDATDAKAELELLEANEALVGITQRMIELEANLLSKLVVDSNYPNKDFSDPKVLCERTGAGPAARKALKRYFFGGSTEPEEATGETETAPSPNASDSSEVTDSSEAIPPIS